MATDLNKTLNLEDAINNLDTLIKKVELLNDSLTSFSKTTEESAKSVEELNKAQKQSEEIVEDTAKASTQLDKIKQQNLKTVEQLNTVYSDENKQLIGNKLALQEANKEVRNEIKQARERFNSQTEVNKALETSAKTIKQAETQNKALRKAVKEIDVTTEDGRKTIEKYNKVIEENDALINSASDAYIQQKRNIGAYQTALDGIKGGFMNATAAAKAFLANPIGAVVASLAAAFGALKNALNSTEEGQRLLTQATGFLNGILSGLNEIVIALIDPLVRLFTDPQQALEDFQQAIKDKIFRVFEELKNIGLGVGKILSGIWNRDLEQIKEGAKETGKAFVNVYKETNPLVGLVSTIAEKTQETLNYGTELAKIEAQRFDLEKERNKFIVREAELQRDISEEILRSRNISLDVRDRQEAITRATELTNEKFNEQLRLKREQLRLLEEERELGADNLEDNREYAQLQAEIIGLEKTRNDALRQLTNRANTLTAELERQKELEQDLQSQAIEKIETSRLYNAEELEAIRIKQEEEAAAAARAEELRKAQKEADIALTKDLTETSINAAGEAFGLEKEAALAKAGINIAEGITKAIATGGFRGIAQAAVISAAGAVQIAKIAGLNAYYKGTEHAKKGLAWVAERGAELIEGKDGRLTLVPDLSLIDLQGGEKIHTAAETKQMLFDDTRIVRELRRQKQTVIVNINKDTFNSKYRMKA